MKKRTQECDKCGRQIALAGFDRHYKVCKGKKENKIDDSWLQENGLYKCPYCNKEYSKKGILIHIWRVHMDGKFHNPNRGYLENNRVVWNKNLTEKTDVRVKEGKDKLRERYATGELTSSFKGKHHTEEFKQKLSLHRIAYLTEHPEKVPYRLNHSSKMSYPEMVFQNALEQSGITGWVYNFQNSLYSYDFAFPEMKIDVEIDGGTHNLEKVKKIDERRDEFSKSQGWKVIRFTAKDVKLNVLSCIKQLQDILNEYSSEALK